MIKLVMSTTVKEFKDLARDFMEGQRIDLMCVFKDAEGNLKIQGAHDGCGTLIEDCEIEIEND